MSRDPLLARLEREIGREMPDHPPSGWCVALSGGADSVALLAALVQLRQSRPALRGISLRAVHVHHGLRPAADSWVKFCRQLCKDFAVPLTVRRIKVLQRPGKSLEAEAREARYAALGKGLRRGEWLMAAHHEDDQLETLLLQLMRGAGVAGLAAMPRRAPFAKGLLLRPLLAESRATLERWLRHQDQRWVEDDSNVDERFDRNYLRHRVLPLLRARWPAAASVAARSAAHQGDAREILESVAAADLLTVRAESASSPAPRAIDWLRLGELSAARQRNVLRHWLARLGLPLPDAVHLERIRCELPAARIDAQPVVRWSGAAVRRFRSELYAFAEQEGAVARQAHRVRSPPRPVRLPWRWRRQHRLALGPGRGVLRLVRDACGDIDARTLPTTLWVGARVGGERLQLDQGPRRDLKELLRVAAIPPWERELLPVIFASAEPQADRAVEGAVERDRKFEAVIAVARLGVAIQHRASSGVTPSTARFRLVWEAEFC